MRYPARVQAAIELLGAIEAALSKGGAAADVIIKSYFRNRRYAGSKDRAAVGDLVYGALRRRAELLWRLGDDASPRAEMICFFWLLGEDVAAAFDGSPHAPEALSGDEQALLAQLSAEAGEAVPGWVAANVPDWLAPMLALRFGAAFDAEAEALNGRAPLDLRVNGLASGMGAVQNALRHDQIPFHSCRFAPWGLRLDEPRDLSGWHPYRSGWVEIQDEGAQIAAALAGARPGDTVIDLCAGAGGKSLALAADMKNQGVIHAFDTVPRRLEELEARALRAGAGIIETHVLPQSGPARMAALEPYAGKADLVVLDVPCSGTGTWRRNPEARWRLTPEGLGHYAQIQARLLEEGAGLLAPGGRLLYITCSLLPPEDEDQVAAFLAKHPDFHLVPYERAWPRRLSGPVPETLSHLGPCLCLSPRSHGTDGFFMALLQK